MFKKHEILLRRIHQKQLTCLASIVKNNNLNQLLKKNKFESNEIIAILNSIDSKHLERQYNKIHDQCLQLNYLNIIAMILATGLLISMLAAGFMIGLASAFMVIILFFLINEAVAIHLEKNRQIYEKAIKAFTFYQNKPEEYLQLISEFNAENEAKKNSNDVFDLPFPINF